MDFYDVNGHRECDRLSNVGQTTGALTDEQCRQLGVYPMVLVPAPEGCTVTGYTYTLDGDHVNKVEVYLTAEEVAAQQAAQAAAAVAQYQAVIQAVIPIAQVYRAKLQQYFGAGAETNQAITKEYVAQYFIGIATGQVPCSDKGQAGLDSQVLNLGFQTISAVTGDGTTWSFPWQLIP